MSLAARLSRNRITLQVLASGRDGAGQPIETWANFVTDTPDGMIGAELRDVSGREFVAAGATQNEVLTTITIRYRAGVLPKMRVLHGADIYGVEAVLGQDRRTLALMCSRGVA